MKLSEAASYKLKKEIEKKSYMVEKKKVNNFVFSVVENLSDAFITSIAI